MAENTEEWKHICLQDYQNRIRHILSEKSSASHVHDLTHLRKVPECVFLASQPIIVALTKNTEDCQNCPHSYNLCDEIYCAHQQFLRTIMKNQNLSNKKIDD